jgi:hypothetical protein
LAYTPYLPLEDRFHSRRPGSFPIETRSVIKIALVAVFLTVGQNTMPCEFFIDTNRRLVISRGTGTFRDADFLEHMETLGSDPRFKPEFDHVVDCRKFDLFDVTAAQIQDMGGRSIFAAKSKRAFVVSSDLHFGLGCMFAGYRDAGCGQLTTVFRDMRDAIAWLGLPQDYDPSSLGEPTVISKSS